MELLSPATVESVAVTINSDSFQHFTIFVIELLQGNKALYKPCSTFEVGASSPIGDTFSTSLSGILQLLESHVPLQRGLRPHRAVRLHQGREGAPGVPRAV